MMVTQKIGRTKTNMRWQFARIGVCIAVLGPMGLAIDPAQAESIPSAEIAELKVFPPSVNLNTNADRQSIVVQAVFANELTRDVTAEAKITPANSELVRQDANTLFPNADGQSEITEFKTEIIVFCGSNTFEYLLRFRTSSQFDSTLLSRRMKQR